MSVKLISQPDEEHVRVYVIDGDQGEPTPGDILLAEIRRASLELDPPLWAELKAAFAKHIERVLAGMSGEPETVALGTVDPDEKSN